MSLNQAQVLKLLELGKKNGRVPMVRIFGNDAAQHAHRAMLLGFSGQKAIVKPQGHGKTEEVDLRTLAIWKSGNSFDLTEVEQLTDIIDVEKAVEVDAKARFLVYNPSVPGYWYREYRRWQLSPMSAIEYVEGTEGDALSKLVTKFGPFLRLVPIEEARSSWVAEQKERYSVSITDERVSLERKRSDLLEKYCLIKEELVKLDRQIRTLGGQQIIVTKPALGTLPTQTITPSKGFRIKKDVLEILRKYPNSSIEYVHGQLLTRYPQCPYRKVYYCLHKLKQNKDVICVKGRWSHVNQNLDS